MTTGRFLVSLAVGLTAAAACLALAAVLDAPGLAVGGFLLALLTLGAREAWLWRGRGRQWAVMTGGLIAITVLAFVVQKLVT